MMYKNLNKRIFFLFLILIELVGCLTVDTHGSIKAYVYHVPKNVLQKVVEEVIAENSDIQIDTTKSYILDISKGKNDTIFNNTYNNGTEYLTIKIKTNDRSGGSNEYIVQYFGDEKDWDTAKISTLSIAYAYDVNGKGGSQGDGDVTWYTPFLKHRLTSLFESKFIDRIDKKLADQHTFPK